MFRHVLMISLWAVGVLFGSQMLMGFLCGIVFFGLALAFGRDVIGDTAGRWIGHGIILISVGLTIASIVLGIKGQLPGTRSSTQSKAG